MGVSAVGDDELGLAVELLNLARSPKLRVDSFLARAGSDGALAESVVRVANAPLYGLADCIRDLERATFVLGPRTVARIAVGVAATGALRRAKRFGLWEHCLDMATCGEAFAETLGLSSAATDLHAAGWLHVFEPAQDWPQWIRDSVEWRAESESSIEVRTLLRAAHEAHDGPEQLAPLWNALGFSSTDVEYALACAQTRAKQLAALLR